MPWQPPKITLQAVFHSGSVPYNPFRRHVVLTFTTTRPHSPSLHAISSVPLQNCRGTDLFRASAFPVQSTADSSRHSPCLPHFLVACESFICICTGGGTTAVCVCVRHVSYFRVIREENESKGEIKASMLFIFLIIQTVYAYASFSALKRVISGSSFRQITWLFLPSFFPQLSSLFCLCVFVIFFP